VSYLLDTNVVSEWTKPRPNSSVAAFLASTGEDLLFLSVITLAELRRGVDRLPAGRRRVALDEWLESDLEQRFDGRILGIDRDVASVWGRIMTRVERRGGTPGVMDVWIAAIAEIHGLTVVTRDAADFAPLLESVFNPWNGVA
jgi:predicted nucleic acid-binding protein